MATAVSSLWKVLKPARLAGPLFDKELRVSSRRKRNYVLRFVYVGLLTAFVVLVWQGVVAQQVSTTFQKSRMAEAGRTMVTTIVGFQFAGTQVIAIIMLSTSISDEIYNKTLGLLMTTPISSFQIVMGKLSSKLLQLLLLLAISLPLLAIVRVFGGVSWEYVLSSLCITFTAVVFAGTLSLLFSIRNRRAYVVIIKAAVTAAFLYCVLPIIVGLIAVASMTFLGPGRSGPFSLPVFWHALLSYSSPYYAMTLNTAMLMSQTLPAAVARFYWPVHCAVMLALSMMLMSVCAGMVRRVALRQAAGQVEYNPRRSRRRRAAGRFWRKGRRAETAGLIRPVKGSPVLWKDVRAPFIRGAEGRNSLIGLVITIAVMLATYWVWAKQGLLDEDFTHVSYTIMFLLMAMIFHMVLSASSITSEKEARCWPILLATPMGGWQILVGKAAAVIRRCLVVWLLAAGHVVLFVVIGYIHPIAMVHLSMIVMWVAVFLTSMGLYFSARFKRTTWAVVATFGLAFVLWVVGSPVGAGIAAVTRREGIARVCMIANPALQTRVVMRAASGRSHARARLSGLRYEWLGKNADVKSATFTMAVNMLIYIFFGLLFAWRAKCRLRRNVF